MQVLHSFVLLSLRTLITLFTLLERPFAQLASFLPGSLEAP